MNFHLKKHRKLTEVVLIPEGLQELMADIAREVLRYQPDNIECFIADYLEAMLLTRDVCNFANETVEDVLDSGIHIVELLQKEGIPSKKAKSAVKVIKNEFESQIECINDDHPLEEIKIMSRLIDECSFTIDQAQEASEIIEGAWHLFYQRHKKTDNIRQISPDYSLHYAVKNTLKIYKKGRELSKRLQAAVKIQAWYRGLKIRKTFLQFQQAAITIQAAFKGYGTRKQIKLRIHPCYDEKFWKTPCFQIREKAAIVIQSWIRALKISLRNIFGILRKKTRRSPSQKKLSQGNSNEKEQ
ncbi:CLUMA_CG015581, isoform A [Clunio marinus]|uniref:CLUMA_CG015581, isoform A n=1 Tax=Clunio marinus TaxID=568069 RepID=A0A1J1IQD7_9DIPT|nr:CLUMA_CG015581, isoform A [Clunio marinus]